MNDSKDETLKHIQQVQFYLDEFITLLKLRGRQHDKSKLGIYEKPFFDKAMDLKNITYGTNEYKQSLEDLGPALKHHYENNSHHPNYYDNGMDGMDLLDIVEMLYDWLAACKRHTDGDIYKSLEVNKERFNMSEQLVNILTNTIKRYNL